MQTKDIVETGIDRSFLRQCISKKERKEDFEIPPEWRKQVLERLQQAVNELEETRVELPDENQLDKWNKKYRRYSQV